MIEAPETRKTLTSWKEVAAFFGTTTRTVMRWERERGLPIRRLPGEARSRVYADVEALTDWMKSADADNGLEAAPAGVVPAEPATVVTATPATTQPSSRHVRRVAAFGLAAAAALALAAFLIRRAPPAPLPPDIASIYDTANQNFDRRTPASLAAAIAGFTKVTEAAPQSADGFVGLASAYAVMPEYTAMPAAEAFAKAEAEALKAIRIDSRNARAHAVYAFARYYGALDEAAARRHFDRAVALDPRNVQARHWRATFLLAVGDFDAAIREIDRARALDPASDSIAADRAGILGFAGRVDEARKILEEMVARTPEFRSPHAYLAAIAFETGDDATFVRESAERARLQNDLFGGEIAAAAKKGLAAGGRRGMLEAMLEAEKKHFEAGVGSAIEIARLYLKLGDRAAARRWLDIGLARREPEAAYVKTTADMRSLADGES